MTTLQREPRVREVSTPPAGRHLLPYNDQARMWDRLGQRSPESFPAPRHVAEVTA